jgi:plastocyanin
MRRLLLILSALFLATPALAQEPEWRAASEYDVLLRPWAYEPNPIRLEAGRPVKLRFVNQGQATHSFAAREFFRAARVRSGDRDVVADGHFRLAPGERRTIALVPAPGRYRVRSGNIIQRLLGMSAVIIVE